MLRDRHIRFYACLRDCYGQPTETLLAVIRDRKRFTPRLRAAAPRELTCRADLNITHGQPYGFARRAVRAHYRVWPQAEPRRGGCLSPRRGLCGTSR